MTLDENVQAVRGLREELIRRHGGLDGWIRHLVAMDQARTRSQNARRKKKGSGKVKPRVVSRARRQSRRPRVAVRSSLH
jgi:hypothetical protein